MQFAIDSNILIRYFTQDIPELAKGAEEALQKYCTQDQPGFISLLVCAELDWALRKNDQYKYSRKAVYDILNYLLRVEDFELEQPILLLSILDDFLNTGADLADLIIMKVGVQNGCKEVLTLDKKVGKLKGFKLVL